MFKEETLAVRRVFLQFSFLLIAIPSHFSGNIYSNMNVVGIGGSIDNPVSFYSNIIIGNFPLRS